MNIEWKSVWLCLIIYANIVWAIIKPMPCTLNAVNDADRCSDFWYPRPTIYPSQDLYTSGIYSIAVTQFVQDLLFDPSTPGSGSYLPQSYGPVPFGTTYSFCSDPVNPPLAPTAELPNSDFGHCGKAMYGYKPFSQASDVKCTDMMFDDINCQNFYVGGTNSYKEFGATQSIRQFGPTGVPDPSTSFGACGCTQDAWCPNSGQCSNDGFISGQLKRSQIRHTVDNIYTGSVRKEFNLSVCHAESFFDNSLTTIGPPDEAGRSNGGDACNPNVLGSFPGSGDTTSRLGVCICDNDYEHWTTTSKTISYRKNLGSNGFPTALPGGHTVKLNDFIEPLVNTAYYTPNEPEPLIVVPCSRQRAADVTCQNGGERGFLWDSEGIVVDNFATLHTGVTYSTRRALGHPIKQKPFGSIINRSPSPLQEAMKNMFDEGIDPYIHFFSANYANPARDPLTDTWLDPQFSAWQKCACPDESGYFGQVCELAVWDYCPYPPGVPNPEQPGGGPFDATLLCGAFGSCSWNGEWLGGLSMTSRSRGNPFYAIDPSFTFMALPECTCLPAYFGNDCQTTCTPACDDVGFDGTPENACINVNSTDFPVLQCQCASGWADSSAINGLTDDQTDPGTLCDTCRSETGEADPLCNGHGRCPLENINSATPANPLACECDAGWNGRTCTVPDSIDLQCGHTFPVFSAGFVAGIPVTCNFSSINTLTPSNVQILYDCPVSVPDLWTGFIPYDLYGVDASCTSINLRDSASATSMSLFPTEDQLCEAIHDQCVTARGGVDFCPLPFSFVDGVTPASKVEWFCDRPVANQLLQGKFYRAFTPCWLKEKDLAAATYQCINRPSDPTTVLSCEIILSPAQESFFREHPDLFSVHIQEVCRS